ncbi:MAG TPA: presqualene diphosphate synthase HpnD [Vicinamibacteria bacterium]|nr:presqualene diphosphate synthase HpnD [Vicinamibacteria bacterium]
MALDGGGGLSRVPPSLAARITRQSGTNFYYAFRILPARKRRAMFALYSFCRVVDDCVDEPDGEGEAGLVRWLAEAHRCYAGQPTTELGRELAEALFEFPIPRACFEEIVDGCRMDLTRRRYATFADLRTYCEKVASAVGLASIEIFEYRNPATRAYAVELGVALQLTNMLRDVAADAERGRLYVPLDELARFGVGEAELLDGSGRRRPEATALLDYQAARAREHYRRAAGLLPPEDRRAMVSAEVMAAVYRALLDELVRRSFPVGPRLRLSSARKLWLAARTLARVYGGR